MNDSWKPVATFGQLKTLVGDRPFAMFERRMAGIEISAYLYADELAFKRFGGDTDPSRELLVRVAILPEIR